MLAHEWTVSTSWDVKNYISEITVRASGLNITVEDKLRKKFHPIYSPTAFQRDPCVITDQSGNVLLWYLPRAMSLSTSVSPIITPPAISFEYAARNSDVRRMLTVIRRNCSKTLRCWRSHCKSKVIQQAGVWSQRTFTLSLAGLNLELQA